MSARLIRRNKGTSNRPAARLAAKNDTERTALPVADLKYGDYTEYGNEQFTWTLDGAGPGADGWVMAPVAPSDYDVLPRYVAETVDSGEALTRNLTHIDMAAWPAGDLNDQILINEDGVMQGVAVAAGERYRAVRTTAGGVAVDWQLYTPPAAVPTSDDYITLGAADAVTPDRAHYAPAGETYDVSGLTAGQWVAISALGAGASVTGAVGGPHGLPADGTVVQFRHNGTSIEQAPVSDNVPGVWTSLAAADPGVLAVGDCDVVEVRGDVTIPALTAGQAMQVRNSTDTPINLLGAAVTAGTPPAPVLTVPGEALLLVVSDGTTLTGSIYQGVEVSGRFLGAFVDVASIVVPAGMAGSATPEDGDKAKVGNAGQETLHIYADGEWIDVEESEKITPSAAILPTPGSDTPNSLTIPKLRDGSPLFEAHFFVGDRRAAFTARRATIVLTVSEMVGTVTKTVVLPGTYNFTFVWTEDADNYYVDVAGTHVGQLDVFNSNFGVTPFYQATPDGWGIIAAADDGVITAAGNYDVIDVRPDVTLPATLADGAELQVRNSTKDPVTILGGPIMTGTPLTQMLSIPAESMLLVVSDGTTLRGSWVVVSEGAITSPWLPSTAATAVEDGDRLIVMTGSTLALPAIPAAGDSVVVYLAPDSKWEGLAYTIATAGADTFPTVEVFGNSRVTAIGLPGETEWRVYEGADGAIESNIVVDTRADLPAAATVFAGRTGVVLDEGGAQVTALGTAGQPAVGWST